MPSKTRGKGVELFDPEIERTARRLRKEAKEKKKEKASTSEMGDEANRPMRSFADPNVAAARIGIQPPTTAANSFELKPSTIVMVQQNQYGGTPVEDPHAHLRAFERICNTFKINGMEEDAIKLRLFGFSLKGRAETWVENIRPEAITTWAQLKAAFLQKFFPPGRTAQLMADITHFSQWDQETLYEAWERYKEMIKKCPHHGLQGWVIIQTFFAGLHPQFKNDITAAAGGALMEKSYDQAVELIENLAEHSFSTPRSSVRRVASVQESDELKEVKAQLAMITNHLRGGNPEAPEQVQFVQNRNNQPRNDPFSNTYNEGWRKHPNLSWSQPGQQPSGMNSNPSNFASTNNAYRPPGFQQRNEGQSGEKKPGLEDMMMKFMSKMENTVGELASTINTVKAATENNTASIKVLERQMGQISASLQSRDPGKFPSMPESSNREHCNAIFLRSGKELMGESELIEEPPKQVEDEFEMVNVEDLGAEEEKEEAEKSKKQETPKAEVKPPVKPVVPSVPFPGRLKSHKDDVNYFKFLDVLKQLHINIPFVDALMQLPSYARFMKEILTKKRAIDHHSTVALTEECSAILQHKLPNKLKDPGSFSIPVQIGKLMFNNVLCDLGASINLMPLSMCRKLGLGKVSSTKMTLKLADGSLIHPHGVIEDVLVKVGKFYFPVDFVVVDMREDAEVPLILGRSFLATSRALIDVEEGEITFRVGGERVAFKMRGKVESKDGENGAGRDGPAMRESATNRMCGRFNSADAKPS